MFCRSTQEVPLAYGTHISTCMPDRRGHIVHLIHIQIISGEFGDYFFNISSKVDDLTIGGEGGNMARISGNKYSEASYTSTCETIQCTHTYTQTQTVYICT